MYKINNCMVPNYLLALFPRTDAKTVHYNLRNRNDFKTTARSTALYENSFIRQLSTAGTIFLNTYEIVRILVVSNVLF